MWGLRIFFDGVSCRASDVRATKVGLKTNYYIRIGVICIFLICFTEFNRFSIANRLSRMRALTWHLRLCIRSSVALKLLSVAGKRSIARNYERFAIWWKWESRQAVWRRAPERINSSPRPKNVPIVIDYLLLFRRWESSALSRPRARAHTVMLRHHHSDHCHQEALRSYCRCRHRLHRNVCADDVDSRCDDT